MKLADAADIATIVAAFAVPLSALFIWLQLRQQTLLSRAENHRSLVELVQALNISIIENKCIADLWVRGAADYTALDDVEKHQYRCVLFEWLNIHENIFAQHRLGLIDKQHFDAWIRDLQAFVKKQQLKDKWKDVSFAYSVDFQRHVMSHF